MLQRNTTLSVMVQTTQLLTMIHLTLRQKLSEFIPISLVVQKENNFFPVVKTATLSAFPQV